MSKNEFIRFYSRLFTLGSLKRNLSLFIALETILLLYILLVKIQYIIIPVVYLLILPLEYVIFKVGLKRSSTLFNIRRLIAVNYISGYTSLLFLLMLFLNISPIYPLYLSLCSYIIWKTIVYSSLTYEGFKASMIPTTVNYIFLCSILYYTVKHGMVILASLLPVVSAYIYVLLVEQLTKINKYGAISYLKGYVSSWVLDRPEYIENLLKYNAKNISIPIHEFYFKNGQKFKLVIPYFHFGPFRNVGSSAFPREIIHFHDKNGISVGVFHATITHDYDLVSNEEMYRVINIITNDGSWQPLYGISRLIAARHNDAIAYGFKIGNVPILMLSYREIEDLPLEIAIKIKDYGEKLGFSNVIVIDAHNSLHTKEVQITDNMLDEIYHAGRKVLNMLKDEKLYDVEAVFRSLSLPNYTLEDGLGNGGLSLFIWKTGEVYNLILIFDANNMNPRYREDLTATINSNIKKDVNVVVVTTDTHEVTARGLVDRGYSIWGSSKKCWRSIEDIIENIHLLMEHVKFTNVYYRVKNISVKTLGENILDKARRLINKSFYFAKTLLLIPIISILIGMYLISLL